MKYTVTAQAFLRSNPTKAVCEARKEVIDTENNLVFENCVNSKQVKETYEAFWNDVNPESKEVVKVLNVEA